MEGSSYLEIYFEKEGDNTYKGIQGTKEQIIQKLDLDDEKSFESNIDSLIGKKVNIKKDRQTGWITDMEIIDA